MFLIFTLIAPPGVRVKCVSANDINSFQGEDAIKQATWRLGEDYDLFYDRPISFEVPKFYRPKVSIINLYKTIQYIFITVVFACLFRVELFLNNHVY